jgi:heme exporter protein A
MNSASDGLQVDKVHVWRGDRHVLKGVSLELWPHQLLHVSGPNGAGKSTLLRVLCGLLRPEEGVVAWRGRPILKSRLDYYASLAYASHDPALKGDLTCLENLRFSVGLRRRITNEELRAHLRRTGVEACADLPARVLSAGQRRRAAMARILASGAALWLLDEPFTNLDSAGSELLSTLLAEHMSEGGLAVVVAHQEIRLAGDVHRLELAA